MRDIAVHAGFLKDFAALEPSLQKQVGHSLIKFRHDSLPGSHLEKINAAANPRFRSLRVTRSVRAVVLAPRNGRRYALLKVLPHDDAYEWARRTRLNISASGKLELFDPIKLLDVKSPTHDLKADQPRLFESVGDTELEALGISSEVITFARQVRSVEEIDSARSSIPDEQWDALFGLAVGMTPEEIAADLGLVAETPPSSADELPLDIEEDDLLDLAMTRSSEQLHDVVDDADLERILERPFDAWRIYLHPSQREVVNSDFAGPARITGGPGTGKTVVCVHRAKRLAARNNGRVLLTTYTNSLKIATERALDLLITDPDVRNRIDVVTIDKLARDIFEDDHGAFRDGPHRMPDHPENLWRITIRDQALPFNDRFLEDELVYVVFAQDIRSEAEYLSARRVGRGRRLGPDQRKQVWAAMQSYTETMRTKNQWTFATILREAARLAAHIPDADKSYRYAIVDEAQDLSPDHWRLLRNVIPLKTENSLFIAGDARQRIYKNVVSLRQLGITVAGRSRNLSLNHRTSAEVLSWATQILAPPVADDIDPGDSSLRTYRSSLHSREPLLKQIANAAEELDYVAETIELWNETGVPLGEIGVAVRERKYVPGIVAALKRHGIVSRTLKEPPGDVVSVGPMHSMKGLEFRCVAVTGASADRLPRPGFVTSADVDRSTHDLDMERERQLLFVACTRARDELIITWVGEPSELLPIRQPD